MTSDGRTNILRRRSASGVAATPIDVDAHFIRGHAAEHNVRHPFKDTKQTHIHTRNRSEGPWKEGGSYSEPGKHLCSGRSVALFMRWDPGPRMVCKWPWNKVVSCAHRLVGHFSTASTKRVHTCLHASLEGYSGGEWSLWICSILLTI